MKKIILAVIGISLIAGGTAMQPLDSKDNQEPTVITTQADQFNTVPVKATAESPVDSPATPPADAPTATQDTPGAVPVVEAPVLAKEPVIQDATPDTTEANRGVPNSSTSVQAPSFTITPAKPN